LRAAGFDVLAVAGNVTDEDAIKDVLAQHRERWGRLDVLINNAGLGIGANVADMETKKLDLQIDVNLRAVYLVARESIPLLKEAGAEHGKALMVNTASIAGKQGQPFLSAYSATKFGVVGLSQGLHRELMADGIQVTALCPAFVATPMTDWIEGQVPKEEMIQPEDIAESVRFLLKVSPACIVPEIQFLRRGDTQI
jgi:NAD(P)-dependent dehydrogenase (short-subunit alcohol dehydrogenase family)